MVEDILEPRHSTLLDRYTEAVYIEFPTNLENSGDAIAYLSIIMSPHLIATIRRGEMPAMQTLLERLQHEVRLPFARTIAVLYYILDHFIDKNTLAALKLRDRIGALERAFVDDPGEISLSMVTQIKQQIRALTSIAEDQRYCVMSLKDLNSPVADFTNYESYIRDLVSNTEHVLRALGRSEKRVSDLERTFQLTVHDASDKRLRILTIISAIFLPLTLITGFFGMNFRGMILLNWQYGFWLALAA
jgi:magnesium transporter